MSLPKELEISTTIRFQDCDPFGHLNNARFIDYFMNAREDQLKQYYDFSIFGHGKATGQAWVVTKTQISYLFPAQLTEEVVIQTRLIQATEATIAVEGIMFDKDKKRPKAIGWIEFAYVGMSTGKPVRHGEELMTLFNNVVEEGIYSPEGFNQRVDALKAYYRKQSQQVNLAQPQLQSA